ncbi:MAG TPA: enoyl-CoA hydratase/isomerase family protein [Kiritimatiellia bacterium]
MTEDPASPVQVRTDDGILWITLNNPPHNLMGSAFFDGFKLAHDAFSAPDVRAVVLTGAGRSFSKGADLRELKAKYGTINEEFVVEANKLFSSIEHVRKPVVAAINGACFGGGLELSLACHVRVCSDKARIGLPELTAGVVPGLGGITRLIRVIGESRAMELMLLGDLIPAEKALAYGLVSRIFPADNFLPNVNGFVRAIMAAPAETIDALLDLVAMHRFVAERGPIEAAARSFAWLVKNAVTPF